MSKLHILVVDDDRQIRALLGEYLEKHGYRVSTARDGNEMWRELKKAHVDLVVLDVMMPGEDGLSLCRKLRDQSEVSIIMLSAVGDETDRVVGLEVGADDYLAKPFGPRELLARIKALLRRSTGNLADQRQAKRIASLPNIRFNDWSLDQNKRRLIAPDGVTVPLSASEYDLLVAFLENVGRVLNRDQLLDITRGREAQPFDRTIDVQVARLRKKIEKDPKNPQILTTVRGGGYQFEASVQREE
ncbi:MAG: response regulator transcription factor [Gammaproteobacteria bacterium]|nr:response regulator transcription factor [Gammaproteobacteria bacterium]MCH9744905.1 response regulator transcription factor [Gammaproteobacteria bacterium]